MTDIPIPPEVVEALRKRITDSVIHISTAEATAALRAALAAWPGMHTSMKPWVVTPGTFKAMDYIALPLAAGEQ